jgi:protein PhnA
MRGTSSVLKVGTKIKNIRIVDGDHDIDRKTEPGPMMLKSGFLKKS